MSKRRWLLALLGCVVLVAALTAFKVSQIRDAIAFAASFPEQSETIEVVVAQPRDWQSTVAASGEVIALRSLELRNQLEGQIVALGFNAGAAVSQGQLLLQLDSREEQAQLKAANAQTALAELATKRYQKLLNQNAASRDRYDQAQSELAVTKANAESLRARIDKKTLRAPFDAVSGLHNLEVGQYIAANTLITHLIGTDQQVWVDFNLPQQQSAVSLNTPVNITSTGLLKKPLRGTVVAKDAAVMTQSRNLRFRVQVNNAEGLLKPGALVEVEVPMAETQAAMILPATAIRHDNFGAYVYLVVETVDEKNNTTLRAQKQTVVLGPNQGEQIIVLSGVERGDVVASNGSYKLRSGLLVKVKKMPLNAQKTTQQVRQQAPQQNNPQEINSQGQQP